jgi:hypothetical protein
MRFKTLSGAEYKLNIEDKTLTRKQGKTPILSVVGIIETGDEVYQLKYWDESPFVGQKFAYSTEEFGLVHTSVVVAVLEDEDEDDQPLKVTQGDENEEEHVKIGV